MQVDEAISWWKTKGDRHLSKQILRSAIAIEIEC